MSDLDLSALCPGIREAVRVLREAGFETTDSGDGSHYKAGMEGAFEEPMVAIRCGPDFLREEANNVFDALRDAMFDVDKIHVEAFVVAYGSYGVVLCVGEGLRR